MDMAAKDDTEGRCPACRTPYDKERIVGMTVNTERHVLILDMHIMCFIFYIYCRHLIQRKQNLCFLTYIDDIFIKTGWLN